MNKVKSMSLTHDEVLEFEVAVRVRIWCGKDAIPLAIVEPARDDDAGICRMACRAATWIGNAALRGKPFRYVEHTGGAWHHVAFDTLRHACVKPHRTQYTRSSVEYQLGVKLD